MRLAFLLFDGFTALDVVGGYEVLARLPGVEVEFTAIKSGVVAADTRRLGLVAYRSLREALTADILFVPGGPGIIAAMEDPQIINFIRECHAQTQWTVAVCNGVVLLGAAGVLRNKTVTTNYFHRHKFEAYGATIVADRYCRDGKILTGAGVSASIDMSFFLASELAGHSISRAVKLGIEYFPSPPFPEMKTPEDAPADAKLLVKIYEKTANKRIIKQDSHNIPFTAI